MEEDQFDEVVIELWDKMAQIQNAREHWWGPATQNQIKALQSLLSPLKMPRNTRLAVITVLAHYAEPLPSFKHLKKWDASKLIDFLKDTNWSLNDTARQIVTEISRGRYPEVSA